MPNGVKRYNHTRTTRYLDPVNQKKFGVKFF